VEIVHWAGGKGKFRWQELPKYVLSLRRVIKEIQPDLIHAGPIQTCAFIAVMTGFRPTLTMSWGFDLMQDVHKNRWTERITHYVLHNSTFFTSDAQVTRDKAVAYGMNPDRTAIFLGRGHQRFAPKTGQPRETNQSLITVHSLLQSLLEPLCRVDVLAGIRPQLNPGPG
jgi:hypothetical protein